MAEVSVVVISYNSPILSRCISSLQNQSCVPKDIILVEAGEPQPPSESGQIQIVLDHRGSQAHSRNLGATMCSGDVLAFLDSDCVAPPGWIENIKNDFHTGEKAVGGPYLPGQETQFAKESHRRIASVIGGMSATFAGTNNEAHFVKSVSGGNCAFDINLFRTVGGFDERQHWREEPELGRKIRESGTRILFDPELWVHHWWKGWDGLVPLAKAAYFYGRIRVKSKREIEH